MHVYQLSAHLCVVHQNAYVGAVCLHQRHHGGGARIRRFQRPDHGQRGGGHAYALGQIQAMDRHWRRAERHRVHHLVFHHASGLGLCGGLRLVVLRVQRRIYNERHRLLGHGAGAGAPRRRPQPSYLPHGAVCGRGAVSGRHRCTHVYGGQPCDRRQRRHRVPCRCPYCMRCVYGYTAHHAACGARAVCAGRSARRKGRHQEGLFHHCPQRSACLVRRCFSDFFRGADTDGRRPFGDIPVF